MVGVDVEVGVTVNVGVAADVEVAVGIGVAKSAATLLQPGSETTNVSMNANIRKYLAFICTPLGNDGFVPSL